MSANTATKGSVVLTTEGLEERDGQSHDGDDSQSGQQGGDNGEGDQEDDWPVLRSLLSLQEWPCFLFDSEVSSKFCHMPSDFSEPFYFSCRYSALHYPVKLWFGN